MKTLPLLRRVRQIKSRARLNVVNMPATAAVVFPVHTGLESSLDPADQQMSLTSEELADSERCFAAGSHERTVHSPAVIDQHSEDRIFLSRAISIHMRISHLDALRIFLACLSIQLLSVLSSPLPRFGLYVFSILCLPPSKILASLARVLSLPSFVLRCELFWVFSVIALLAYTSKLAFTFWGTYSLGDAEFSSAFSSGRSLPCSLLFQVVSSPLPSVEARFFTLLFNRFHQRYISTNS